MPRSDVQGPIEGLEAALKSLSTLGFVNYYGMQRFGASSVPTHAVGCAMLKEDWRAAGEAILKPRGGGAQTQRVYLVCVLCVSCVSSVCEYMFSVCLLLLVLCASEVLHFMQSAQTLHRLEKCGLRRSTFPSPSM